ncbi:alpha/beta hydrolase [Winogradskyella sp. PC-19]|uniref:alpha/beta hydrolase family protein n=1 Tax=unclassified Winogradskyella TaxID=2615021 RepID=UPI000B3CA216|nr:MULTISPECIES: alpha/beta fold hydrolase [unclassified Winogradskyella]ARV09795.1 alpha/beta hydrolase [Winogradskyella sp. PC-19]RZN82739.1 MAG: alpha/beta hydrolase [Winogradskyella sp.]
MYIEKNTIIKRYGQKPMVVDTFYNPEIKKQPIIIFSHGYKGFKDWGAWNIMAKTIAKSGFCFLKFNFSHNGGTVENPIDFPDLKAFGNNNYTKEINDLGDVINWSIDKFENNSAIDTTKIYLIGHSRGGGITVLKTAEDNRIKKLVTLASVCDFEKRTATFGNLEQWKKDGVKYVTNGRTKQQMPHYYQFYEDFIKNKDNLNIKSACKKINVPHLIIHGESDTSIAVSEAENLNHWNPKSQLNIIKGANHVFNVKHPWTEKSVPKEFKAMMNASINFLK